MARVRGSAWRTSIDPRLFLQANYTPYEGDASFVVGATERTTTLWERLTAMFPRERERGVYDVDPHTPAGIDAHAPGYIDRDAELLVGLQADAPLKRAIMPNGGWRVVETSPQTYGYEVDPQVAEIFTKYRKTHNDRVFDAYTAEILAARRSHVITGLPDSYGRGRIIGDYRRVALYGVDRLIADKRLVKASLDGLPSSEDVIRDREELAEQIRALAELKVMASGYGFDISGPAATGHQAIQWVYFGYLAAVKEQNGAAMSLGRVSTFLDVYLQRDITEGRLDESRAQELIDDLVIKLRIVRFLRTPEYDDFAAAVSIGTSSIQYESDDLLRPVTGDDTAIACCVSAMTLGRQMQFFGARVNLAKTLLYAINGGRDEINGTQVGPVTAPVTGDLLDYDDVLSRLDAEMDWLAKVYVDALNVIHYMHDKYAYERLEMALHDHPVRRTMAMGIAGLAVTADSLSAIRDARVTVVRDPTGLVVDYTVDGDYPAYGNNDDRADDIAVDLVERFMVKIRQYPTYRGAVPTQSVLTITSNVVYGEATGNTPDGRRLGEPFSPGANPMNGRDQHGWVASALSVAKLPYDQALDGISLTSNLVPTALGRTPTEKVDNLTGILDAFFGAKGFHVNVNVLGRETLLDAMEHPDRYPQLTVRVSGYAVNFVRLTRDQQLDVIHRTFHGSL